VDLSGHKQMIGYLACHILGLEIHPYTSKSRQPIGPDVANKADNSPEANHMPYSSKCITKPHNPATAAIRSWLWPREILSCFGRPPGLQFQGVVSHCGLHGTAQLTWVATCPEHRSPNVVSSSSHLCYSRIVRSEPRAVVGKMHLATKMQAKRLLPAYAQRKHCHGTY
jgi:hypothetical protein